MRTDCNFDKRVTTRAIGFLFVLNRDADAPVFPIEERPVPQNLVVEISPLQSLPHCDPYRSVPIDNALESEPKLNCILHWYGANPLQAVVKIPEMDFE